MSVHETTEKQIVWRGRHINMAQRGRWEFADRENATGIAVVVPLTEDGSVVFIEQHRPPVNARVIEWPAGLVGDEDAGEASASAAGRELLEETGYEARSLRHLFRGAPSAGICSEVVDFYLATGLEKTADGGGVGAEKIEIHVVPLAEAERWLGTKQAEEDVLLDAKIYSGLYFAREATKETS